MDNASQRGWAGDLPVLEQLIAGGEMVPAQLPSASSWTAEKRLAGAVLMSALVEIRDRHADLHYRRRVKQDLEWVFSDDVEWPFSFVRLCHLFELEPAWVRAVVDQWRNAPTAARTQRSTRYCHAA